VGLNRASGVEVIILHHANVAIITMVASVQTTRKEKLAAAMMTMTVLMLGGCTKT
jgi:hypothetical protein